jgi:hypothetical protein
MKWLHRRAACVATALLATSPLLAAGSQVLIGEGTPTRYLANLADPGLGTAWAAEHFDDRAWIEGRFGIGYDTAKSGQALIETAVPFGASSIYTRTSFDVASVDDIRGLWFGANYDDGFAVWVNGHEVARSRNMPGGELRWGSQPLSHEFRHHGDPARLPMLDVSAAAIPLLHEGRNVLAIGVWNHGPESEDLLLVPLLVANQPLGTFVTRGPYLQSGNDRAVTVRWRTDRPSDSRVDYGLQPGSLDRSVSDPRVVVDHEVRLDGLEADTTYHYAVGSSAAMLEGGDDSHRFGTAPTAGAHRPLRAWVIGDSGTGSFNVRAMREGFMWYNRNRPIDLWLMLGDNAYPHGSDEDYQRAVFDVFPGELRRWVLWPTAGNHDDLESKADLVGPYYDIFTLPAAGEDGGVASGTEAYYSFDFANAHFVSLASDHVEVTTDTTMLAWLERDLAATRADWIVVFFHHAPYSSGRHDSDVEPRMAAMRTRVLPLLDAGGVDLVIAGHTHAYQRSALLRGHYGPAKTFVPEMLVDPGDGRTDGTGAYRKPRGKVGDRGIVYVVVGCSGEAVDHDLDHPAMTVTMTVRGSVVLSIDGDRLDAEFVDWMGEVQDRFTMLKDADSSGTAAGERPQ